MDGIGILEAYHGIVSLYSLCVPFKVVLNRRQISVFHISRGCHSFLSVYGKRADSGVCEMEVGNHGRKSACIEFYDVYASVYKLDGYIMSLLVKDYVVKLVVGFKVVFRLGHYLVIQVLNHFRTRRTVVQ